MPAAARRNLGLASDVPVQGFLGGPYHCGKHDDHRSPEDRQPPAGP